MKIKLLIEIDVEPCLLNWDDSEELAWLRQLLLQEGDNNEELLIHSNEVGDTIGEITVLEIIEPDQLKPPKVNP